MRETMPSVEHSVLCRVGDRALARVGDRVFWYARSFLEVRVKDRVWDRVGFLVLESLDD